MQHPNERNLHEVARDISTADLLLYRGQGWISRLIAKAGRSDYSHAAKIDRLGNHSGEYLGDELFCCEIRELKGGRIVTLASQVRKYPGLIDVYRANPNDLPGFDRQASAVHMRQFAGQDYGWSSVYSAALQHLAFIRLGIRHDYRAENGSAFERPVFCSMACAMSDRLGGGIDPVPNLADRYTLPGDLSHSGFYDYHCTLLGV